jgi:hypothetical protein
MINLKTSPQAGGPAESRDEMAFPRTILGKLFGNTDNCCQRELGRPWRNAGQLEAMPWFEWWRVGVRTFPACPLAAGVPGSVCQDPCQRASGGISGK